MLYILLFLLLVLAILAYKINESNLMNPACIACMVFVVSTILAIVGNVSWQYKMHVDSVLIIVASLFIFSVFAAAGTMCSKERCKCERIDIFPPIPTRGFVFIVTIFLLVLTCFNIRDFIRNASLVKATIAGLGGMIKASRDASILGLASSSSISSLAVYFGRASSYIGIYLFVLESRRKNVKTKSVRYLLWPSVPYIINVFLSTGRTLLIGLVTYIITVYGIIMLRSITSTQKELIKKVIKILIVFAVVFIVYGNMRQGSNNSLVSTINGITSYGGFSIPSFDYFIQLGKRNTGGFGSHTLLQIYEILKKFGVAVPKTTGTYDAIIINGYRGNIFTALRRYVEDYGVIGNFFIMATLGFFASLAYNYVLKSEKRHVATIYYSLMIEFIYELSIEERFMGGRLGMPSVLDLIAIWSVWKLFTSIDIVVGKKFHSLNYNK